MPTVVDSNGISVLSPPPVGAGGLLLQEDLLSFARDRVGPSYKGTLSPTANNDSSDTAALGIRFQINSRWFKTASGSEEEFVCLKDTPGAAIWVSTTAGGSGGSAVGKADKVSGAVLGHFASLTSDGNLADSGFASSSFAAATHNHDTLYYPKATMDTMLLAKVSTTRLINTTAPLAGGGALSSDLTLTISPATASVAGSMSAAHFSLLNTASAGPDPGKLVIRDSGGNSSFNVLTATSFSGTSASFITLTSDISVQKVEVIKNSVTTSPIARKRLNFIEGSNVTITTAENTVLNRTDITIAAASNAITGVINAGFISTGWPSLIYRTFANVVELKSLHANSDKISLSEDLVQHSILIDVNEGALDLSLINHGVLESRYGGTGLNPFDPSVPGEDGDVLHYSGGGYYIAPIDASDVVHLTETISTLLSSVLGSPNGTVDITFDAPYTSLGIDIKPQSSIQNTNFLLRGVAGSYDYASTVDFEDGVNTIANLVMLSTGVAQVSYDVQPNTMVQQVEVGWYGSTYGTRRKLNFIPGDSIAIVVSDNDTDDQVDITINATGSASGEANTASNVGTAGVGVFKQKVSPDLQFKKLNAASSRITITDDTGNSKIDLDVPDNTSNQKLKVSKAATLIGTRRQINLIEGSNIGITVADDGTNDRVNITIAATGSASGETNTASNVGSGGIGLYKTKTGVNFEFKNINGGSNKISVTNDSPNSEVDIDVVEANLTHNNIGGILGLAKGGTGANLSATGGTGHYLKQLTTGAVVTVGSISAGDLPSSIDATKIGSGDVNNTKLDYLKGVSSDIQTQLNARSLTTHTHANAATAILDFTEAVQDAVGAFLSDTSTIDFTYNDAGNSIAVSVIDNSSTQKVQVAKAGTLIGTRKRLNFIEAGGATVTIADNSGSDQVDITINSTGGGGSGEVNTASNVNTAGIGIFKQKTGVNLEFKGVIAGSSKVSITEDTVNNEIIVDVNEIALNRANMGGSVPMTAGGTGSDLSDSGGPHYFVKQGTVGGGFASNPIVAGDVPDNISVQKLQVALNNTLISTRKRLNFIEGGNISIVTEDISGTDSCNVTISGVGEGAIIPDPLIVNTVDAQTVQVSSSLTGENFNTSLPIQFGTTHTVGVDSVKITPNYNGSGGSNMGVLAIRANYTITDFPLDTCDFLISRTNSDISMGGVHRFIRCVSDSVDIFSVGIDGSITATSITDNISNQKVNVRNNGTSVGTRKSVNFIPGANISYTVADNSGSDRVDVTINAGGSGIKKYSALIGNGSSTVYTITQATHGCATDQTNVARVNNVSTGELVIIPITYASNGDVTVTFTTAPSTNTYRIVIMG
jgi:hypothetical protein